MSNLDLLVTWIKHNDYPLFRQFLSLQRHRFNKVIIYFSEHNRFPYYDHFIHEALQDQKITWIDPVQTDWAKEDWRNKSTNEMLKYSDSEWVCSIEQDFFAKDWDRLLYETERIMAISDMTGWMNHTTAPYIHPSYWFIKRELLDRTGTDFSPHPEINGSDHFAMTTYKAKELGANIVSIQDKGIQADLTTAEKTDCFHLGGVNINYLDFEDRFKNKTIHRPEQFSIYNYYSKRANVKQSDLFLERMNYVENLLKPYDPQKSEWKDFFIL